jgi:hypothetical protein
LESWEAFQHSLTDRDKPRKKPVPKWLVAGKTQKTATKFKTFISYKSPIVQTQSLITPCSKDTPVVVAIG